MPSETAAPLHPTIDDRVSRGHGGRFYGVYPGLVVEGDDPEGLGRVRVELPWSPDSKEASYKAWARVATMMAGAGCGTWFIPEDGDEVLIAFEAGDPRRPCVVGSVWNGTSEPPTVDNKSLTKDQKVVHSTNAVKIIIEDVDGSERLRLETPGGQSIELRDNGSIIEITSGEGTNTIQLSPSGMTLDTSGTMTINAGSGLTIKSPTVTVQSPMSTFTGSATVQSDVKTPTLIAANQTPANGSFL